MELIDKAKLMQYKALIEKHMSDPVKLRLTTIGGLLILSIVLIYMPLSKKIDANRRRLSAEKERNGCIMDCEKLQKQAAIFRSLIIEKSDTNEWVHYLLDGMREFRIKLRSIESRQQRKVGPYMAVTFSMEIEGKYPELKNYVERLEASPRLVRIDTMNLEKRSDNLVMNLTVLGVVPKK